jgi:hypothetical protein
MAYLKKSIFFFLHGQVLSKGTPLDHYCSWTRNSSNFSIAFFSNGVPLIIRGTQVMKSINEVPLNLTGTVFGITGNLLNFTTNKNHKI